MGFLSYLKDQKIVTDEQIIEGMIYHYNNLPSILETLKESTALETSLVVTLLDKSIREGKTLLTVIKEDQALPENKIAELVDSQNKSSSGFTQWLLDNNLISIDDLNSHITKYKETKDQELVETTPPESDTKPVAVNSAALESLADLGITSDELMSELESNVEVKEDNEPVSEPSVVSDIETETETESELNINSNGQLKMFFTDEKRKELNNFIKSLALGFDKGKVKDLHTEVYKLLGVSKMCSQQLLVKLLESNEKLLVAIIDEEIDFVKFNFSSILKEIKKSIKVAWEIKEHLIIQGNVKKYITDGNSKDEYLNCIQNLLKISYKG